MNKRTTLKEALATWSENASVEENIGDHIPFSELYELLSRSKAIELEEKQQEHLTKCPTCLRQIKEIVACMKAAEAWDVALPKAATSETRWPKKIRLEGGKYTVIIRRNIHKKNNGLIMLQVEEGFKDALEGRTLQLLDGQGRICLEGTVFEGKISQEIEDLDAINLKHLTVRPNEK